MKIKKIDFAEFDKFYKNVITTPRYDEEFLYHLFDNLIEIYNENISSDSIGINFKNINAYQLFIYLYCEYDYVCETLNEQAILKINQDEDFLTTLISVAIDKYLTNEKIDLNERSFTNKYSPNISTISLYLNFMNKIIQNYSFNNPEKSLISDILLKCIKISKCSIDLLVDGFESEAFSTWRTLHETECILYLLVKYQKPIVEAYLRHMNYSIAYRKGIPDQALTDKIFEEIKENLRSLNLKSKDMKKYIEYGYLLAIPNIQLDADFKLNFRDGVEKLAGLSQYSKLYEYSSEIAHSSPLMIYSNEKTLYHLTLLSLYEVFFRIEKVFTNFYLNTNENEEIKKQYLKMRAMYYSQMLMIYEKEKKIYQSLNKK